METQFRRLGLVVIVAIGLGCGPSVMEQANAGSAGATAASTGSTSAGAGGEGTTSGAGGSGGAGGAALVDPGMRLSQGEPACLLHEGSVTCYHQLVDGQPSTPGPWHIDGIDDAQEVTFAVEQACARRATGKVACWGWSHHGQLGLAVEPSESSVVPIELPEVHVDQLATGHHAVCGIEPSGQAICWGGAYDGPLGDPSVYQSQAPIDVIGANHTVDIALGMQRACAVRADGSVLCWTQEETPTPVPGIDDAVEVAVFTSSGQNIDACALRADGTVACWGKSEAKPVAGLEGVAQLSGALLGNLLCARTGDGRVFCLSSGGAQGGDISVTPIDVHDAIDISAGQAGVCAVRADGSVACWGHDGASKSFPL